MIKKFLIIPVIIIVLIVIFVGQWQLDVGSDCTIDPAKEESQIIYAQTPGFLSYFSYRSGDVVEKDTVLGKLKDIELQDNLEQIQATLKETEASQLVIQKQVQEKRQAVISAGLRHQKAAVEYNMVNTDVEKFLTGNIPPEIELLRIRANETKREYQRLAKEQEKINKSSIYPPDIEATSQRVDEYKVKLQNQEFIVNKNRYLSAVGAIPRFDYEKMLSEYEIAKREYNSNKAQLEDALKKHYETTLNAKDTYNKAQNEYDVKVKEFLLKNDKLKIDTKIASAEVVQTSLGEDTYKAQLQENEEKIKALKQKLAIYLDKERKLTLKTPITGVIIEEDINNKIGKHFEIGEEICKVAGLQKVLVRILVDEKDIGDIQLKQQVRLKVRPFMGVMFKGEVVKISPVSKFDEGKKRNFYPVEVVMDNQENKLKPGMTGFAKINCGPRPIYQLIAREIGHLIRSEYWFF